MISPSSSVAVLLRRTLPSASAPPSARRQPRLLLPPPPFFHWRTPLSLLPLLPLAPPSALAFSSYTAVTANPTAFLLRDAVAGSSENFVADDMWVLTALTLLRRRRPRLRLHQPAGPSFPTRRRSHRPRPLPSPLFPSRRRRGQATGAFFLCFLTASSPPSPLRPPSIVGRLLLLRRCSLQPRWPGNRCLPPPVPPSHANASSVAASQSFVNPVVDDTRSSLPPFSSIAPRLRHCRRGEDYIDLLRRSLPLRPRHRSLSFLVCILRRLSLLPSSR